MKVLIVHAHSESQHGIGRSACRDECLSSGAGAVGQLC